MFKNYFKITVRSLKKNKLYTLINIFGLGLGIATVVWAFQNYRFAFSFNDFHKDPERVFRVFTKVEGNDHPSGTCPMPLAIASKNEFPAVEQSVRWSGRDLNIRADQNEPFACQAHFTDPAFFNVFNFPLLQGSIELNNRSTVLVTEKAAKKFFGTANPIGKTLQFYSDEPFRMPLKVTGVLKDPPLNSSLQFELITNFENLQNPDGSLIQSDDWGWFADAVFLKLSKPGEATGLTQAFNKYLPLEQAARKDVKVTSFSMESLKEIPNHFREIDTLMPRPEDSATYGPIVLALLVLLSVCLNFANTTVAQSNRQLKEIGVRKVLGSSFRQIASQQLIQCSFVVLLAVGLSVIVNKYWLPTFNAMFVFVDVRANYFSDFTLLLFLGSLLVGVTLLAGSYPSFYVSRFNAANIFRGSVKFGGSNLFSRVLLGLQIVVSFITVIAGIAFSRNSEFQRRYNYGYDKENIIGLNLQSESAFSATRDELNKIPDIEKMAGTRDQVGFSYHHIPLAAKGQTKETNYLETGQNYLDAMNLKLVAGREFGLADKSDIGSSILINEKLAFEFGWKPTEAIGQQIRMNDTTVCTVIGVLKDFTLHMLYYPVEPVAMSLVAPEKYSQIIIQARRGSVNKVYEQTKAVWAKLYPNKPFRGYFQDTVAANALNTNENIATIFFWFAIISVIIAATGMFALISLTVLKRMKEIAIRKVVGAGSLDIFKIVLKGYSWIFLLAAVAGCYAGYNLSKLLMDMIFKINAGVGIDSLVVSFLIVLVITAITMGSRVWFALKKKAADVLKAN